MLNSEAVVVPSGASPAFTVVSSSANVSYHVLFAVVVPIDPKED
jgi:hypothetical protein